MPGTPPTTPNFSAPRYNDGDPATFSQQVNSVADVFDGKATLTTDGRLSDQRVPQDASVTTAKIATGAVTPTKIADRSITAQQIAPETITSSEIQDSSIATVDLAPNAVTTGKLAAGAVTTGTLADGSVTIAKLDSAAQQQTMYTTGDLKMSLAAAPPAGWLLCDGSAISRGAYAALFAVLGVTHGAGDGSTTFNLPDLRSRLLVGAGQGAGLTGRAVGAKGGEETHVLTTGEMASHNHGVTDNGHAHGVSDPGHAHSISDPGHAHMLSNGYAIIGTASSGSTNAASFTPQAGHTPCVITNGPVAASSTDARGTSIGIYGAGTGIGIASSGTGISVQANGGSGPHNNMPPFCAVNYFVKT